MPSRIPARAGFLPSATLSVIAILGAILLGCARDAARRPFGDTEYRFGEVLQGGKVTHSFPVHNRTDRDIVIRRVGTSQGAVVLHVDSVIPPGSKGAIQVSVPTQNRRGPIDELANVYTENLEQPVASLHMKGTVVLAIEVRPRHQAYFFTVKGEPGVQVLSLINYGERPVRVTGVRSDNQRFSVRVETVKPGRQYKLTVALDPTTPAGKHEGQVTVGTDSPQFPEVVIPSFAKVEDSLSTSLDTVRFGQIFYGALENPVIAGKSVLVTKHGATDFRLTGATTDLAFLTVQVVPQKSGQSFYVNVRIDPKRAKRGEVSGTLHITTNDPAHPELRIPIRGKIV